MIKDLYKSFFCTYYLNLWRKMNYLTYNNKEVFQEECMEKAIISVVGKDRVGIIAEVCNYLASEKINILDISQTIVEGYFNMMMIVALDDSNNDIARLNAGLNVIGEKMGVSTKMQHEDFFNQMHRI